MDELNQVMTDPATTPEEPVTDPTEQEPVEQTDPAPVEGQPEDTTPPSAPEDGAEATPAPWTLPVKFRHEHRDLNQEEATAYAQMGMKRETEQPTWDALSLLAAGRGQTVQEYVESLKRYDENLLLKQKLEITGGNVVEARKLLQLDLDARKTTCAERVRQEQEAEQQAEQTLADRLAGEYIELQQEFPNIGEFATIPQTVVNDAIRNGRHLLDAYLRYQRQEGKKTEQNRAAQAAAAAASAGSLADAPPEDAADSAAVAAARGVWSVFN